MAKGKKYEMRRKPKNNFKKKKFKPLYQKDTQKVRQEKKWIDTVNTLACPIGSAFVTTPLQLNAISPGNLGNNKVGSEIHQKSLHMRASCLWPGAQATNSPSQVRFVIVCDQQSNGVAPTRNEVFNDGTLWNSAFNMNNRERFIVIADEMSEQIASNGQFTTTIEIFRRLGLNARGPNTASIFNTGSIYLFVAAASGWNDSTSAEFPSVEIYNRIIFTDS